MIAASAISSADDSFEVTRPADYHAPLPAVAPAAPSPEDLAARAKAGGDLAARLGFEKWDNGGHLLYAEGTRLSEGGEATFRALRREFDSLGGAEVLETHAVKVDAEHRVDRLVDATALRMLEDGRIAGPAGNPLPLSRQALNGLCAQGVIPGGAGYLAACPAPLRARNVNHWLPIADRVDAKATAQAGREVRIPRKVNLRLRKRDGVFPEIFAVVGPKYAAFDSHQVARAVARALPEGAKVEPVVYDGFRTVINVVFARDIETPVVGDLFKAGLSLRTADDGSGSIEVSRRVFRVRCCNCTILSSRKVDLSRRHVGGGIAEAVAAGVEASLRGLDAFRVAWGQASVEDVLARYDCSEPATVLERLVENRVVWVPGVEAEVLTARLKAAYDREPSPTKAGILNAVTRAAHESEWRSYEDVENLEATAGRLLYARVWNCAAQQEDAQS